MTGCTRSISIVLMFVLFGSGAALAATLGEVTDLAVVDRDPGTGQISIQYQPACGATDHHIEYGLLQDVGLALYSGQVCGIGASGTFDGILPENESLFFLVVGNDGAGVEGSYGTSFVDGLHAERSDDTSDPVCVFVQDLSERCDIPAVELIAYRPQSEAYGGPFQRLAIPDDEELAPGVGIRVNGDDDDSNGTPDADDSDVANENDLIEVTLSASLPIAPTGLEYALVRSAGDVRAWTTSGKGLWPCAAVHCRSIRNP